MHLVCELSPFVLEPNIQAPKLIYWLKDTIVSGNIIPQIPIYTSGYEHLLAQALKLNPPFSRTALQRHWLGLQPNAQAWGTLQLVHWEVGRDEIVLYPQLTPELSQAEHNAFEQSIAPLLLEDGFTLHAHGLGVWHICGADLAQLECASPERAVGCDMRSFAPKAINASNEAKASAQKWRRISNELQMLLYSHAANDARAERNALTLNAAWLSGCGVLPVPAAAAPEWTYVYVNNMDALEAALEKHHPETLSLCSQTTYVTLKKQTMLKRLFKRAPRLEHLIKILSDVA